ncbi:hypothetical protein KY335_00990 [Candidatus Woesearchaeota archaeon]|nr:hypothetical protein [Candidatus Woesearchaeota archaeon]
MWSTVKYAIAGALLAGAFGCQVAPPKMMCGPGDYEVISEFQNQEAYNWSDLEEIAEEVDHPYINRFIENINFVFFDKRWQHYGQYDKSTFQVKSPKYEECVIRFRESEDDSWKEMFWKGSTGTLMEDLELLIRTYADRMAFRKIYIEK